MIILLESKRNKMINFSSWFLLHHSFSGSPLSCHSVMCPSEVIKGRTDDCSASNTLTSPLQQEFIAFTAPGPPPCKKQAQGEKTEKLTDLARIRQGFCISKARGSVVPHFIGSWGSCFLIRAVRLNVPQRVSVYIPEHKSSSSKLLLKECSARSIRLVSALFRP